MIAASIGRDIHRTSAKLSRLAERAPSSSLLIFIVTFLFALTKTHTKKVAKTTSLFSEQTVAPQLQRLIGEVQEEICGMTQQLEVLHHEAEQLRSKRSGGGGGAQVGEHADTVVATLKLRLGETTTHFRDVLQTRTESLRVQQERKQRYAGQSLVPTSRVHSSPLYRDVVGASAGQQQQQRHAAEEDAAAGGGDVAIAMPSMAMTQQDRYYGMRTEAIRQIENSMVQLQGVFTQLAGIVADQGEMLMRIDHNVDTAVTNVNSAHERLVRQLHKLSQNRWLIIKVFGVLIFFIVIFVLFFL